MGQMCPQSTKYYLHNQRVNELNHNFNEFKDSVYGAVASSIAIASLPQPTDAGYNMFSVGMGTSERVTRLCSWF